MIVRCSKAVAVLAATGFAVPILPAVPTSSGVAGWNADLSTIDGDDVNVGYVGGALRLADASVVPASQRGGPAMGMLVLPPHTLPLPVNRIRARLGQRIPASGSTEVDVRGDGSTDGRGGGWTEWLPATGSGAVFDQPVRRVQVRVTLVAGPTPAGSGSSGGGAVAGPGWNGAALAVHAVWLTADSVAATPRGAAGPGAGVDAAPSTYRVYATREGLIGGTTANGHVIVDRDHFVALPSRRGLAVKNAGDYTVRVCVIGGGRCEYAPVWDVGPWNVKDDYWNPSTARETFSDLAQGTPEAQAAYLSGYHGGKDASGRTVRNPAGIDLGDGTFWDGLRLTTNSWVTVSYLWLSTGARGRVDTADSPLNVRSGPGDGYPIVGLAADTANVPIECWATGTAVTGTFGTTNRWDRIGAGHYVSHAFVASLSGAPPAC